MTGLLGAVLNHLWQSTAFAAAAALATLAFRANRAAIRHAIWLAASAKFLVPCAALAALGRLLTAVAPARVPHRVAVTRTVIETVGQPFLMIDPAPAASTRVWAASAHALPHALAIVWIVGAVALALRWLVQWRRIARLVRDGDVLEDGAPVSALRRMVHAAGLREPVSLVATDAALEPGIFGIWRPTLLWPRRLAAQLDDEQIEAVLIHEMAHVRRRDNLAALLHAAVQALFWWHPIVWWIGARLMDERERACDEQVVNAGSSPERYAETILQACRLFVESPAPCVAGVTGSNLATRIRRIMTGGSAAALTLPKKLLLAALAAGGILVPIAVGAATSRPRVDATITSARLLVPGQAPPAFDVASVHPIRSPLTKQAIATEEGARFTATNVTLRQLIRFAYRLQDFQISGGPDWLAADRFDVVAKASEADAALETGSDGGSARVQLMLQTLLADRFHLAVHVDSREQPIYALVVARPGGVGPQLHVSTRDCTTAKHGDAPAAGTAIILSDAPTCGMRVLPGTIAAGGVRLSQLASTLSPYVGRLVRDETGLSDTYEFTLHWTPDQLPAGLAAKTAAMGLPPIDPDGPSLMTAVREQLGLAFDARKGPVDLLVIDSAERPKEN
jgi:uncharacterized protein (TIGR03435 family)